MVWFVSFKVIRLDREYFNLVTWPCRIRRWRHYIATDVLKQPLKCWILNPRFNCQADQRGHRFQPTQRIATSSTDGSYQLGKLELQTQAQTLNGFSHHAKVKENFLQYPFVVALNYVNSNCLFSPGYTFQSLTRSKGSLTPNRGRETKNFTF